MFLGHTELPSKKLHCRSVENFLAVLWLSIYISNAGGAGSIPGWGTKGPQAVWHNQMGSPIFPSGCEGKLGVALESLQGEDCSSSGLVHEILQARILDWGAMPSSRESPQPRD